MTAIDPLAVAAFDTPELRRLALSNVGDDTVQHAIRAELAHRIHADELAAFRFRMSLATAAEVHDEEARWCCLPGELACAHRKVLADAEDRLTRTGHALAGGAV